MEVAPERRGLEELHAQALEEWAAARLELGETAGLVPLLEELVLEAPLHERRWELLMRALYQAGRPPMPCARFSAPVAPSPRKAGWSRAASSSSSTNAMRERSRSRRGQYAARAGVPSIGDLVRAADEARHAGRAAEAEVGFDRAERLARASSDPAMLAEVAVARSGDGPLSGLNPGTRSPLLDEALARLPDAPTSLRSRLLARLAVAASSNRDPALVKATRPSR